MQQPKKSRASQTRQHPEGNGGGRGPLIALGLIALLVAAYVVYGALQSGAPDRSGKPAVLARGDGDSAPTIEDLPPRRFKVIDDHEHVLDEAQARRVLAVMDRFGIDKMALMGTSKYTFTLSNKYGFEGFRENNEELLRLAKKWPDRFLAFPTIMPTEADSLPLLQDYVARGAAGLKLYLGHGASTGKEPFHLMALDDPRMKPIYRWMQEIQLPIQFHINLTKYYAEFVRVMEEFPYLRVCVPHFGLYKNTPQRLADLGALLDRYPNMYTDAGYGFHQFQVEGFEKYDKNPSRYRDFFTKYAHRLMYSSDMVVEPGKKDDYIVDTLRSYMQVLEMSRYRLFLKPERVWRGLELSTDTLRKIYEETPRRYLLLDAQGHSPDRSRGWPWPGWESSPAVPGLPPTVAVVTPLPPGTKTVGKPPVPGGPSPLAPVDPLPPAPPAPPAR